MTFEDAVKQSVKAYFEGQTPDNLLKSVNKKQKYNKAYFDKVASDNIPKKNIKEVPNAQQDG